MENEREVEPSETALEEVCASTDAAECAPAVETIPCRKCGQPFEYVRTSGKHKKCASCRKPVRGTPESNEYERNVMKGVRERKKAREAEDAKDVDSPVEVDVTPAPVQAFVLFRDSNTRDFCRCKVDENLSPRITTLAEWHRFDIDCARFDGMVDLYGDY
jgi:hypothetical protein